MKKEEILNYFKDINHVYNNSTKYDTLKRMLDELTEPCEDCISREEVLKIIYIFKENHTRDGKAHPINYGTLLDINRAIRKISSVTPKQKTDVVDKIRTEIEENINYNKKMNYQGIVAGLLLALDIIDKYTTESEDME